MTALRDQLLIICQRPYCGLEAALLQMGYQFQRAPTLATAEAALADWAPDLILIDAHMITAEFPPFMAYVTTLKSGAYPPVVVMGEVDDMPLMKAALNSGVDDYLFVIHDLDFLRTRLNAALDRGRLRESAVYQLEAFNEMEKLADDLKLHILPLGVALSAEKDFDRLLELIVGEARSLCVADGSLFFMRQENELRFATFHLDSRGIACGGVSGTEIPFAPLPIYDAAGQPDRQNLIVHAALQAESVNIPDLWATDQFDLAPMRAWDEAAGYHSVSCLAVPLKNHLGEAIGVLCLLNCRDPETGAIVPFDLYHQLVLESLASQAAVALNTQILLRHEQSLRELEREMAIGRQIQRSFLPDAIPTLPGWQIAVAFQPAFDVSGDFYDIFPLGRDRIGVVVADICGKGVGAALFMALVRSLVRAFSQQSYLLTAGTAPDAPTLPIGQPIDPRSGDPLTEAILLTNHYLVQNHLQVGMFATLFLGILESKSGRLTYINCGHNPPLARLCDGREIRLVPTGPALGAVSDAHFAAAQIDLDPGDLLLVFTDGVLDARDVGGNFFGPERLAQTLRTADDAHDLVGKLQHSLQQFVGAAPQTDDITALALWRNAESKE